MIGKDLKRSQPKPPGADIHSENKSRRQFDLVYTILRWSRIAITNLIRADKAQQGIRKYSE
jgi:hypothetical protein